MMRAIFVSMLLFTCCTISFAQNIKPQERHTSGHKSGGRTTVADPAEDNYDIKYLKFNLNMSNMSTAINGDVATTAIVVASSLPAYVFELDTAFTIDSALINGTLLPVTTSGYIRSVTLSTPISSGAAFTALIYYHGAPISGTIYDALGINNLFDPTWYANSTYTLSEPYNAKGWWPCKQSLHDKIDSVDMWVTVPDSVKVGSNGLLQATTPVDATHLRYEWKERYPIDYYLISVAIAAYTDYSYYMHFTGSTDSLLIQNYIYSNPLTLSQYQSNLDSIALIINYFSSLYGRYPFAKEKCGLSMAYLGGGEEHQTMITALEPATGLMAHEFGHQWFGDNITCGTWRDITMNEGFATYSEILFEDHFYNHSYAINDIAGDQNWVTQYDTGTVYVDDTTNVDRILDGRLTYAKGACVLHMLRHIVNNDSEFFHIFQVYQQQLAGGTGTIMDFKNTTESVLGTLVNGINIDTFFSQWMYLQGFPEYTIRWNQAGNDIYIQLGQTTADPLSVPLFTTPVDLQLISATGDTVISIFNNQPTQFFHFTWNKTMTSAYLDPDHWLIYKLRNTLHDPTLGLNELPMSIIKISPNPATSNWQTENVPANSTLVVTDIIGRVLWEHNNGNNPTITIPAGELTTGLYVLKVLNEDGTAVTCKLIKQ